LPGWLFMRFGYPLQGEIAAAAEGFRGAKSGPIGDISGCGWWP